MRKKIFFTLIFFTIIIGLAEILMNFFQVDYRYDAEQRFLDALKRDFERAAFCDAIHFKQPGIDAISKELYQQYFKDIKAGSKVWFFGGSTTENLDCLGVDFSWPVGVQRLAKDITIENFGSGGRNSDESIEILKKSLKEDPVDLVVWAHWANEVNICYKGPTRSKDYLKQKMPVLGNFEDNSSLIRDFAYWAARVEKYFDQNWNFYQLFKSLFQFFINIDDWGTNYAEDLWESVGVKACSHLVYYNTKKVFDDLLVLKEQYGFDLIWVRLPFVEHIVFQYYPYTQENDSALFQLGNENQTKIPFIDLHTSFVKKNLIAPSVKAPQ